MSLGGQPTINVSPLLVLQICQSDQKQANLAAFSRFSAVYNGMLQELLQLKIGTKNCAVMDIRAKRVQLMGTLDIPMDPHL